ncbi:hypothetical protein Tco_1014085, partial [Tanacetum coccineum]
MAFHSQPNAPYSAVKTQRTLGAVNNNQTHPLGAFIKTTRTLLVLLLNQRTLCGCWVEVRGWGGGVEMRWRCLLVAWWFRSTDKDGGGWMTMAVLADRDGSRGGVAAAAVGGRRSPENGRRNGG